jgi:hypothetical protein
MQSLEKLRPSRPSFVVAGAPCRPGVVTPAAAVVSADSGMYGCPVKEKKKIHEEVTKP